ncbi:MAG: helix-turn-helix domain-containing protein [Halorhabdus sp.]
MQHVRLRTSPQAGHAPPIFQLLADAPFVSESRLVDWNLRKRPTGLLVLDGDLERIAETLETQSNVAWDLAPVSDRRTYLRVRLDPGPLASSVFSAVQTEGVIVVKPIVYRDGFVYVRLVGDAGPLQNCLDSIPETVDVTLEGIDAGVPPTPEPVSQLSERQRETVQTALELGYYTQPRQATHADIAAQLDCSTSTVSEHLQKAEATLVRTAFEA